MQEGDACPHCQGTGLKLVERFYTHNEGVVAFVECEVCHYKESINVTEIAKKRNNQEVQDGCGDSHHAKVDGKKPDQGE